MSENRIGGNYNLLPVAPPNNGSVKEKNAVIQTEPHLHIGTKSINANLKSAFETYDRVVHEKSKFSFLNFFKNLFHRGRKGALEQASNTLNILKDENGNLTLEKLKNGADTFNRALLNKALPKAVKEALAELMTELKNETGVRFPYSEEQLKTIFASVNENKNNLLGEGGGGKVYTDTDGRLAF